MQRCAVLLPTPIRYPKFYNGQPNGPGPRVMPKKPSIAQHNELKKTDQSDSMQLEKPMNVDPPEHNTTAETATETSAKAKSLEVEQHNPKLLAENETGMAM